VLCLIGFVCAFLFIAPSLPFNTLITTDDYEIYQDVGTIYVRSVASNTNVYSGTSANSAFSAAFGYVANGGDITVRIGTYTGTSTFEMENVNNVNLVFEEGAILTIANSVNDAVLRVGHSNGNSFTNLHVDGNKANQKTPLPYESINGVTTAYSDDNVFVDCFFTNCKRSGIETFDSERIAVKNSLMTYNGWNGITIGGGSIDCEVLNNEVAHSSDVGISTYGQNTIVSGNYVHDIDTMDGSPRWAGAEVYNNSHWGIGLEDGTSLHVTNNVVENCDGIGICLGAGSAALADFNTVTNCGIGISTGNSGYNTITQNTVTNWHFDSRYGISSAIAIVYGTDNTVSFNTLTANSVTEAKSIILYSTNRAFILNNTITTSKAIISWNSAGVKLTTTSDSVVMGNAIQAVNGIMINSASTNNVVYQNDLTNCVAPIEDLGVGTLFTDPQIAIPSPSSTPTPSSSPVPTPTLPSTSATPSPTTTPFNPESTPTPSPTSSSEILNVIQNLAHSVTTNDFLLFAFFGLWSVALLIVVIKIPRRRKHR
jgi:hypothetical protein